MGSLKLGVAVPVICPRMACVIRFQALVRGPRRCRIADTQLSGLEIVGPEKTFKDSSKRRDTRMIYALRAEAVVVDRAVRLSPRHISGASKMSLHILKEICCLQQSQQVSPDQRACRGSSIGRACGSYAAKITSRSRVCSTHQIRSI